MSSIKEVSYITLPPSRPSSEGRERSPTRTLSSRWRTIKGDRRPNRGRSRFQFPHEETKMKRTNTDSCVSLAIVSSYSSSSPSSSSSCKARRFSSTHPLATRTHTQDDKEKKRERVFCQKRKSKCTLQQRLAKVVQREAPKRLAKKKKIIEGPRKSGRETKKEERKG